jgi:dihydrolipoamide dehydrogenase
LPKHQVVIIGGGPGGYETAIRLNQYKIDCAVIEFDRLGGVCLNWGCIPTKALVKSAEVAREFASAESYGFPQVDVSFDYARIFERKNQIVEQLVSGVEYLFQKRRIPVYKETAKAVFYNDGQYHIRTNLGTEILTEYLIVATGSVPKELPGIVIDEIDVLSSTGLLGLKALPRSLAVIGGGVIGCEFASIMQSFGVQTQIVEFLPRILSTEDEEISKRLTLAMKKAGIKITTGVGVTGISKTQEGMELSLSDQSKVLAEKVLLSVGRKARSDIEWQTKAPETEKGFIRIDDMMRTDLPKVYAIGDVTGKLPLAHTASFQGLLAADHINSLFSNARFERKPLNYANIPRCTFTHPEVASVGYTEEEAKQFFGEILIGRFPFSANGKALTLGDSYGFVKTIARKDTSEIVGMHIIGPSAPELIAQGVVMISGGASADIANWVVFAHPTLSEAVKESIEDLHKLSINII